MNNCNCNQPFYPFPAANCGGVSQVSGPVGCRQHFPFLRKNFVTPPANTAVQIELTDTQNLVQGQGLLIGSVYYQITNVLSSLLIEAKHNGLGATVGTTIIAVHPSYGCYQYPIIPIGMVVIEESAALAGLSVAGSTAIGSSVINVIVNRFSYGYVGPTTIEFEYEFNGQIASTPAWLGVALPVPPKQSVPTPVFSAYISQAGIPKIAFGKLGVTDYQNYMIIGFGNSATIPNAADTKIVVSGKYGILT